MQQQQGNDRFGGKSPRSTLGALRKIASPGSALVSTVRFDDHMGSGQGLLHVAAQRKFREDDYPRVIPSYVFKWDAATSKFVDSDEIPETEGNYDFDYFELQTRCLDSAGQIKVENASFLAAAFSPKQQVAPWVSAEGGNVCMFVVVVVVSGVEGALGLCTG